MSNRMVKKLSASFPRARRRRASVPATRKERELAAELRAIETMSDADIDTSDIPEIVDWRGAERGRFYRPVKQVVTIRLDSDVVAWFKAQDRKYQTAVNRALREYMLNHIEQRARSSRRRKRAG